LKEYVVGWSRDSGGDQGVVIYGSLVNRKRVELIL
jgi:hypothetical protein